MGNLPYDFFSRHEIIHFVLLPEDDKDCTVPVEHGAARVVGKSRAFIYIYIYIYILYLCVIVFYVCVHFERVVLYEFLWIYNK